MDDRCDELGSVERVAAILVLDVEAEMGEGRPRPVAICHVLDSAPPEIFAMPHLARQLWEHFLGCYHNEYSRIQRTGSPVIADAIAGLCAETGLSRQTVRKRLLRGDSKESIREWGEYRRDSDSEAMAGFRGSLNARIGEYRKEVVRDVLRFTVAHPKGAISLSAAVAEDLDEAMDAIRRNIGGLEKNWEEHRRYRDALRSCGVVRGSGKTANDAIDSLLDAYLVAHPMPAGL